MEAAPFLPKMRFGGCQTQNRPKEGGEKIAGAAKAAALALGTQGAESQGGSTPCTHIRQGGALQHFPLDSRMKQGVNGRENIGSRGKIIFKAVVKLSFSLSSLIGTKGAVGARGRAGGSCGPLPPSEATIFDREPIALCFKHFAPLTLGICVYGGAIKKSTKYLVKRLADQITQLHFIPCVYFFFNNN